MKKFWKIAKFVLIVLLMCATFTHMLCNAYYELNLWYSYELEYVNYIVWLIGFVMCFYALEGKFKKLWSKVTSAAVTSFLYTAVVIFTNSLWKYIFINNDFKWELPITYGTILKLDVSYTYAYGWLRYPIVFAATFAICGAKILWNRPKVKKLRESLEDKLGYWLYICDLKSQRFEDLYYDVFEDSKEDKLLDYVENMRLNEENKQMLMRFIDEKNNPYLIDLLCMRFENLLTAEEYAHYRKLYVVCTKARIKERQEYYATAEVAFSPSFKRLDNKFGIIDKK